MSGITIPTATPRRAPHLLMALIEAAITLGKSQHGGAPVPQSAQVFEAQQKEMVDTLSILCKESESFRATQQRPKDAQAAADMLLGAQFMYSQSAQDYLDRLDVWRLADAQMSRVRGAAAETFVGMSASAADKAASTHPLYTGHKDYCNTLAAEKDAAEIDMKVAEQNVRNAREFFRALTSEGGASLLDPSQS